MEETRSKKSDVIAYARTVFPDISRENAFMTGDRCYDIEGAAAQGLESVGVLYGYGSADELKGADYTVPDVRALSELLLTSD